MHFSKKIAVLASFVASGLLHEYVIWFFFRGTTSVPSHGKNMLFFGWNAVLIIMESLTGRSKILMWMGGRFPRLLVSILVVLTALPLGHLFLSDWIEIGYFRHYELGCFKIISVEN